MREQISHFTKQISNVFYNDAPLAEGKNWDETFSLLTKAMQHVEAKEKIVLFFDEFPWMATLHSKLLQNLDYYWNQYWSNDVRIKLIICGSSASWIINNIVNNKGGLHNRLTRKIYLEPLNLAQTKEFLEERCIQLKNKQMLEIYMAMGGIPYYLDKLEKGLSATQAIEILAFKRKSFLLEEFDNLFSFLFKDADIFVEIIKIIASYRYGIAQSELLFKLGKSMAGKGGLEKLKALEDASFILSFKPHWHKEKGIYYKVIDNYSLFYLSWIEPIKASLLKKSLLTGYWDNLKTKTVWNNWAGLAFESICYEHLPQITKALNLSPTAIPSTWRYVPKKNSKDQGAQIDLLFDRDDDAITICEIKYSEKPFVITKEYADKLKKKCAVFKTVARTKKQIFIAFISANGP